MKRFMYLFIFFIFLQLGLFNNKNYITNTHYNDYLKKENVLSEARRDNKVVFLTFDDGPSYENTNTILNILNEYNVKASFFVIGNKIISNPNTIAKMYEQGMDILPHCNNHSYKKIYESKESYFQDLHTCINLINNKTNNSFDKLDKKFVRLPGGSDNKVSKELILKGIREKIVNDKLNYIDWNVSSQDAEEYTVDKDKIVSNVMNTGDYWNISVVLFHDSAVKKTTPKALPQIINFYKEKGYTFKKISEMNDYEFKYLIKNRVINKT